MLWLDEIPKEKECYSILHNDNFENANFDKWVEIKKPKIKPYSEPPEEIRSWLKEDSSNKNPIKEPELYTYIISESSDGEDKKIFLEDSPEIEKAFKSYLEKWRLWSKEYERLSPILKLYEDLFKIYRKNQTQPEDYQIILGLGLLSSKNRRGKDIKRHIIETPLSIRFDSIQGKITVEPFGQSAELSLETDMLEQSEKPQNSDSIKSELSNLSNDFWKKEEFYNCLKSWLNSYDSGGQFFKSNAPTTSSHSSSTLTVSPAIILKKRNQRTFIKFYNEVISDLENCSNLENTDNINPCLSNIFESNESLKENFSGDNITQDYLAEKHYFPLAINEEQEKIIKKTLNNNQIVVQGPPGTGKTHSIANLISHFLATGKKILVTSQTDRALKVLKEKLPKDIQKLCIEILGKDQSSLEELKKSFSAINSEYQNWDSEINAKEIKELEEIDNNLKGKIAKIKNQLVDIKNFEFKKYERLFDFYTGTPAIIANCVKDEEEKYQWIKEEFNINNSDKCPISNHEAKSLLSSIQKLKDIDDSILKESLDFSNNILTLKEFEEKLKKEIEAKQTIEKIKNSIIPESVNYYNSLKESDLNELKKLITSLISKSESLLNRDEKWVEQALKDCLSDRDREWRYLYESTHNTLDKNKENFLEAEKITEIKIQFKNPPDDLYLTKLLKDFFSSYKANDKIRWGWICSKTIRDLKKIKIDQKNISSYEEVKKLDSYVKAKRSLEKINTYWENQGINTTDTQNRNFMRSYHIFKDFCEPLEECLSIYKFVENIKQILSIYDMPQFQWSVNSIKEEIKKIDFTQAEITLKNLKLDFEKLISFLENYKAQKNRIANKIYILYKNRDQKEYHILNKEYEHIFNEISDFKDKQKAFDKLCEIRKKLNNESFYKKLRQNIRTSMEKEVTFFEDAWAWRKADQWLKEQVNENRLKELNQKKEDFLKKQRKNMEKLTAKKAWRFCLSQITNKELSSLRAWIQSVNRIGRGKGRSAPRHRKEAKKRMEECKTAIPAWIMPLYRVVENIKPNTEPFDIAIIDEASQTGPDGFLLNYIAKKVIVVGDKEQISPENIGLKDEDVEILKKRYISDIKFSEYIGRDYSYYDYCEILFTGSHIQLREHFRCMPEIIKFSNDISYSGTPLIPLRQYGSSRLEPLKLTYVDEAISKIGGGRDPQNDKEAKALINQMKDCINDPKYKGKTFGVIVLQGKAQIKVIEESLGEIDKKEIEERQIRVGNSYKFQGDERDVIFLSMAISKDWNYSALTRENYKRQYNVAVSRAKDQVWLFHSIELNDLSNNEDYRKKLLKHFTSNPKKETVWPQDKLNDLYKKIKETKNKSHDNVPDPFDSWFEARVFHIVASKGYNVISQHKVSYVIDMIIIGSNGRLAVECDGEYWHSGEEKEQQDLERQWNLERCGWTFWRLKESLFNRNEEEALKNLWKLLNEMQIYPLGHDKYTVDGLTDSKKNTFKQTFSSELNSKKASHSFFKTTIQKNNAGDTKIDPRNNSIKNIGKDLLKIIQNEGPLVTKRLFHLYVRSCGISKVGRQIRKKLNKASWSLKSTGLVVFEKETSVSGMQEGVFYLPNNPSVVVRKNTNRTIDEIPLSEIKKVMDDIQSKKNHGSDEETVFRLVLNFYGFNRLTTVAHNRLKKAQAYKI